MQAKYLKPETLTKLGPLDVVARQVVEGIRIGMHRSPVRGISTEFSAYRQYVAGDEIRHVDWKLYARTERPYVKLFDAETNFIANLLLDASSSMTFQSGGISKLEYAKFMAATLAYLIVDQRDSAGVGIFDGELRNYVEPKSTLGILADISRELEKVDPRPRTDIASLLHEFAGRMKRRGMVFLFSDLLDNTDDFLKGIGHLRFRGHNVTVFHILDPHEIEFPLNGVWRFEGLENDGEIVTQPARVRAAYLKELEAFITDVRRACVKNGADYVLVNTNDPIESILSNYLLQRTMAAKTR
ncbi:MAG: DUF58 domain-containing protein [Opitutae bacterium]